MSHTVFINALSGRLCAVKVKTATSVCELKRRIEASARIPAKELCLLSEGRVLRDYEQVISFLANSCGELTCVRRDAEEVAWIQRLSDADFSDIGKILQAAPDYIRARPEVIFAACRRDRDCFRHASDDLRADRNFAKYLLDEGVCATFLKYASDELRSDPEFVLKAIETSYQKRPASSQPSFILTRVLTPALWSDRDFVRAVIQMDASSIYLIPEDFSVDEDFVLAVIEGLERPADLCKFFKFIPVQLLTNRAVLLAASKKSSWIWHYAQAEQLSDLRRSVNLVRHVQSPWQCASRSTLTFKKDLFHNGTAVVTPGDVCESPASFKELIAAGRQKQHCRQQRRLRHIALKGARRIASRNRRSRARDGFVPHSVVDLNGDDFDRMFDFRMT